MGITSTITLASSAGEQLHKAIAACESSADAVDRGIAILATSEDEEGPIAASRAAAAAWRDELRTVARELGQITGELDRLPRQRHRRDVLLVDEQPGRVADPVDVGRAQHAHLR